MLHMHNMNTKKDYMYTLEFTTHNMPTLRLRIGLRLSVIRALSGRASRGPWFS